MDPHLRTLIDAAIEWAVDDACSREMIYGENDCVLWASNILAPFVGFDPAGSYRGHYHTEDEARTFMGAFGLARVVAREVRARGWHRIKTDDAEVGDVGIVLTDYGPACALSWRMGMWVGPRSFGFSTVKRDDPRVRFAWKIAPCRSS